MSINMLMLQPYEEKILCVCGKTSYRIVLDVPSETIRPSKKTHRPRNLRVSCDYLLQRLRPRCYFLVVREWRASDALRDLRRTLWRKKISKLLVAGRKTAVQQPSDCPGNVTRSPAETRLKPPAARRPTGAIAEVPNVSGGKVSWHRSNLPRVAVDVPLRSRFRVPLKKMTDEDEVAISKRTSQLLCRWRTSV